MSTLPEQFSAARRSQLEAQVNFFRSYTAKAVESAEMIISLNLNTTRASLEKSSAAVRQLMTAKDPRDLLALTTQAQENFDSIMAYSRALFSLASGAQLALLAPAAKVLAAPAIAQAPAAAPAPAPAPTPAIAAVPAPVATPEPAAEPAAAVPPVTVKAKPIAKAASKVAAKPAASKPAAAPFPAPASKVVVTGLKAVEASPPVSPPEAKQLDMLTPKPRKKGKSK